jgi:predicted alpha/beta superfamily hydrolase
MRTRFCVSLLAVAVAMFAPDRGAAQSGTRQIELGEARSFRSEILNEDRQVQIALPESYSRTTISYPVLFLLDGSSHLLHASATTRFLASARNRIPEMIVIALPNTNRNRDMTPGPGAVTFQRVLAEEVIPWVERTFRAAPERVVFGHSLSASFAVHTLLNRPELFDAYVAASAPIWRYENLEADIKAGLPRAAKAGAAVYLTVGEHENENLRAGVQRFAATLRNAAPSDSPAWSFVDMKDEDHNSTPQRSLYNALEARYKDYRFPFFEDQSELDRAGGLQGLEAHYQRFAKRFGYSAPPPEAQLLQVGRIYITGERHDDVVRMARGYAAQYAAMAEGLVNQVGYDQLKRGQVERAVQTFKNNADAFPDSPNVHDSLGDAYCRAAAVASAQASYERAARAAEKRSPTHPRIAWYRDKAKKGCAPLPIPRADGVIFAPHWNNKQMGPFFAPGDNDAPSRGSLGFADAI